MEANALVSKKEKKTDIFAALLMVLSALSFSAMQLMIKLSNSDGALPVAEQAFFRNAVSLVAAFVILRRRKVKLLGEPQAMPLLLARSVSGLLSIFAFFYATNHAAIGDANILNKLSPVISTILAILFLKEKAGRNIWISLALSFVGAWIVCGPSFHSNPIALSVALLSAVLTGASQVFISALKNKAEPLVIIFTFSLFSVVVCPLLMINNFVMPTLNQFGKLLLIGVFGSLGQVTQTYSLRFAPATRMGIYNYSGIIWSILLGWSFMGEVPGLFTIIGGALVILASALPYFDNISFTYRKNKKGQ